MNEKPKPSAQPAATGQIEAFAAAGAEPLRGKIEIMDYDPSWPLQFAREAERIRAVLGSSALAVEHTGSTSVAGLAGLTAKPIIDIVLTVTDSVREEIYAPAIVRAGYKLAIREPEWFEHRLFKRAEPAVNLHVFSDGCSEVARMRLFRDWLRGNAADRILYEQTKRLLAELDWSYVQNYADAKTEVITQIMTRAQARAERLSSGPEADADRRPDERLGRLSVTTSGPLPPAMKETRRADRLAHPYPQPREPGQALLAGALPDDARECAGGP